MKLSNLIHCFLFLSITAFSQEVDKETSSITEEFDKVYKTSSSYKEFKVIRKVRFQDLKSKVSDSIEQINKELRIENKKNIKLEQDLNNIIKKSLQNNLEMVQAINEKKSISFFGFQLKKSIYKIIIWFTIILLIFTLFYFIYQFKNSYKVVSIAKKERIEAEEKLATFKKNSLEREQKLRRKIQDEINKQRGV
tara:strand:- start:2633 stop:3214 length:582 start_codon:yes stop_codon:yes gene_type:complete